VAACYDIVTVAENWVTVVARIGMLRALNRHVERVFDPSRKDTHWGKRKLTQLAQNRGSSSGKSMP